MPTRTRPSLPRSSSSWVTAPTASSSKRWSGRTGPCTPTMRRRSTSISARPGSKTSRRLATPTRSSCARTRSSSTVPSRWVSWSTSSRSSVCSSSTTSSWTSTSTGGTSSSSRWTRTACTSHSPARSSRTRSARGTRPSSRRTRSSGWPGTSGATASLVYSSSRSRPPSASPCAASAFTWRTGPPARRRSPPRGSTSARTRCAPSGSSRPSRAAETWQPTGLPHAQRRNVHVRAAQARPERVLRQALGVAGRYPHGADRVPPVSRDAHPTEHAHSGAYPPTMGRGRSGFVLSTVKKSARKPLCGFTASVHEIPSHTLVLTSAQLEALQHMSNEQLAAAILSPAARPSTPYEQSRASAHRVGSTPRAFPVS